MAWRKAQELRARQKLAERTLESSIARVRARIERGPVRPTVERLERRIERLRECLARVRAQDWGAQEMERI